MKSGFLVILTAALFALSATAHAAPEAEEGNSAYLSGKFEEAAQAYEKALETKGASASLLYNLGNTYYRMGEFGPAILAYERALALDPRAADIQTNLRQAREAAAAFDESHQPAPWEAPVHWLSFNEWAVVCAVALGLLAAVSLAQGLFLSGKKIAAVRWAAVISAVVLFISITALVLRLSDLNRAIVLTPDARVRLSPFETADTVATLKAGWAVQVEGEHDGFYRIRNGWISRNDAALVHEPSAAR